MHKNCTHRVNRSTKAEIGGEPVDDDATVQLGAHILSSEYLLDGFVKRYPIFLSEWFRLFQASLGYYRSMRFKQLNGLRVGEIQLLGGVGQFWRNHNGFLGAVPRYFSSAAEEVVHGGAQ